MRINKYLAQSNLGSRRKVEEYIKDGRIKVNGEVCKDLATDINPATDTVMLDSNRINLAEDYYYIALNKPKGYLVTKSDEFNRKTIFDLLPDFKVNLFPVGRLDKDSEGLILVTNDGHFADCVMHPRNKLEKVYKVTVSGFVNRDCLFRLREGIFIDEGPKTLPAKVFIKKNGDKEAVLKITITEGRNRQIRKMLEKLGHNVIALKRLQIGDIKLSRLPAGMFRLLQPKEIISIMNLKR